MKHRYTKLYRPQINGKIERFWETLKEDFIEDALYNDIEDLKEELLGFDTIHEYEKNLNDIFIEKTINFIENNSFKT